MKNKAIAPVQQLLKNLVLFFIKLRFKKKIMNKENDVII